MGLQLNNTKLLCDDFARAGYLVVAPDVFAGDPVPESLLSPDGSLAGNFDWAGWTGRHTVKDVEPILDATIAALKSEYGVKHLGAAGYCFGGKYVVRYLAPGKGVEVGFVAHPSLVEAEELKAIDGPLSIAAAETDQICPPEKRRETEEILLGKEQRVPFQITLYSDVEHGFAVRTDLSDRRKKFAKESAYCQAVRWFDEWLKN
jgi:dienelactone hydrolase